MTDSGGWESRTLYQQLLRTAAKFPHHEFVVCKERRPTFQEFLADVDQLAKSLLALGIKKGDNVAIWMGNRLEWPCAWLACASIGACLVPMNTRYRAHEVDYILKQSDAVALIMQDRFLDIEYLPILSEVVPELGGTKVAGVRTAKLPKLEHVILAGERDYPGTVRWEDLLKRADEVSEARYREAQAQVDPGDRVIMVYTSGTTGFPKGAMHSHDIQRPIALVASEYLQYTGEDRILLGAMPYFHVFGSLGGVLSSLLTGATHVVMDAFDPGEWLALWARERCTSLMGVPTVFIAALDHPDLDQFDLSSGRTGLMGGALCPVEVVRAIHTRMGAKVLTAYGMTETSGFITCTRPDDDAETIANTVGRPFGGWEAKIVDPNTGEEMPVNTQGEIWVRGYNVMMGYYNMREETTRALDADGWFHTGDLGTYDERGYYRITGRLKDMFIVGGFNTYPAEIEDFLFQHPKIKQVSVIGVPDHKLGEVGMVFVELKEGRTATADEIVNFCKGRLANFKVPRYVEFVSEWPLTASGKVQKFKLRGRAVDKLGLRQLAQTRMLDSEKK